MTEEDCGNSQNFNQAKKPCKKCGKFGHIKFECRVFKPHDNKATCTSQHCRCQHTRRKIQTKEAPIDYTKHEIESAQLCTVVVFDVPINITNLKEFGSALMVRLNTGISSDEYRINRARPNNPWRDKEVQILFKSPEVKEKFENKAKYINQYYCDPKIKWNEFLSEPAVKVEVGDEVISVRFREEVSDEMNKLLNKALTLKHWFKEVIIYMSHHSHITVHCKYYWSPRVKTEQDLAKVRVELMKRYRSEIKEK